MKKVLLGCLALSISLSMSLLLVLLFFPSVLINPNTVDRALKFFKPDSKLLKQVNQADWKLEAPGFLDYDFSYKHPNLCIELEVFTGCLDEFVLGAGFKPFEWTEPKLNLRVLSATIHKAKVKLPTEKENSEPSQQEIPVDPVDLFHSFQSFVSQVEVGKVALIAKDVRVLGKEKVGVVLEDLRLNKTEGFNSLKTSLKASGDSFQELKVIFELPWTVVESEFLKDLKFEAGVLSKPHQVKLDYRVKRDSDWKSADFVFSYQNKASGLHSSGLVGVSWSEKLRFFLQDTSVERKQADFFSPKVLVDECYLSLENADSPNELVKTLWGSVLLSECLLLSKIEKSHEMLWGNDLFIDSLSVKVLSKVFFSRNYEIKGRVTLSSNPFSEKLGEGELSTDIDFERIGSGELKLQDAKVKGKLKLHSFRNVASTLNQYFLAIPAPFHVLDGTIDSSLEGEFLWDTMKLESKLIAKSDLSSEHQRMSARLESAIRGDFLDKKLIVIDANLVLLDSQVQLPEFDVKQVALPIKDSRLVVKESSSKKKDDLVVKSRFSLRTQNPLRVKNPEPEFLMPINIKINGGSSRKVEGSIRLEPFESHLFNRKIRVENFEIELPSQKISALLTTKALEYDVSLIISGKPDSIKLNFQSSPPLERRQIIALLLFNDPKIAEESEKAAAAGNFDVAAAQGALSLASFYMFGNSRLQSFNYDPSTGSVSARLRLNNGSSVELIAGEEGVEGVGYVRRIGQNWRIKTLGKDASERQSHSGQALIEWFKYFD